MRLGLLVATVFAVLAPGPATAAEPEKATVELRSALLVSGLPLAESAKGVYGIRLSAQVDKKGEGAVSWSLTPTYPRMTSSAFRRAVPCPRETGVHTEDRQKEKDPAALFATDCRPPR